GYSQHDSRESTIVCVMVGCPTLSLLGVRPLYPKADVVERDRDVRLVPKADIDCADQFQNFSRDTISSSSRTYRTREELVPHCSEGDRARCSGTMGDGPTYVERATEGTGCLPARLQRAIDFMRFIAGRMKFAHSLKPSWR